MDHWVDSPLNKAHYYERRGTALARRLNFNEAIECHATAAQHLLEALPLTDNEKAQESIRLQHKFHLRQKEFLKVKRIQYEALREALRVQKEAMSRMLKVRGGSRDVGSDSEGVTLQKAIYRTIEEADSLLELLVHRGDATDPVAGGTGEGTSPPVMGDTTQPGALSGSKRPKDENTVIEELRIVNYQLRSLITELMSQLSASEAEVSALKLRVSELESDAAHRTPQPDRRGSGAATLSAYSSPFVFSPADGLSPDGAELAEMAVESAELPALAPLAMPDFDLSVLHKKHH